MNSLQHIINRRDWENPISVQVNQVKAHSPLNGFKSVDHARTNTQSQKQSLNGQWDFKLFDKPMPCITDSCVSSADSKIPKVKQ